MVHLFCSSASRRFSVLCGLGLGLAALSISACRRQAPPIPSPVSGPAAQPSAGQGAPPPGPPLAGGPASPASVAGLPPLDQLLAPIALYPDPLIALILPSATVPADIEAAAQFLNGPGDPGQIGNQSWSDSVKGLAHYPDVVKWMSGNIAWTQQVGGAFASEPAQVMDVIQDLRARAQAAGTLRSGPQDQVVTDNSAIEIEPAQPDVIYVPSYDPNLVYFGPPPGFSAGSYFYWGDPYPMGIWLTYDFDWRGHAMWRGDWYDYRRTHGGWGRPIAFAAVRFSDSRGPQLWRAPANAPHWSGVAARDYAPVSPLRELPPSIRDQGPAAAPRSRDRPEAAPRPRSDREPPTREERDRRDRP